MTLVRTFAIGRLRCHALDGGRQRLDGGAMFGVVPKPLWEQRIPADSRNRIPLALRCLLIEHDDGLVLVDTGLGNKENEKFIDIYGVENAGTAGPTRLDDALAELGHSADDVRWVVNTHLHFDHAGGNTAAEEGGTRLGFPNATYVVQEDELTFAGRRNERTKPSYLPPNFDPITEAGRWRLVRGETELLPGVRLIPTPGHVPHHQSVLVQSAGETLCFLADLVPTVAHIPLPWIMGYDLEPLVTLETKRAVLGRALQESWVVMFEHDPATALARITKDDRSLSAEPLDATGGGA